MLQIIKFTTKRCKDITYFGIRNHPWFTFRFLYMLYFMKDIFQLFYFFFCFPHCTFHLFQFLLLMNALFPFAL